jgi:hypothetical protein
MRKNSVKILLTVLLICICALLFCACKSAKAPTTVSTSSGTSEESNSEQANVKADTESSSGQSSSQTGTGSGSGQTGSGSGEESDADQPGGEVAEQGEQLSFALTSDETSYEVTGLGTVTDTDIVIPATYEGKPVTAIAANAFMGKAGIASVIIPSSVTSIGLGAFSGCFSLQSITLPFVGDSIKTASDTYQYPLGYIFGTSSYEGGVATTQSYYGSSASSTTSTTFYIPSALRNVTITGGNILFGAFYGCSGFTSVTIGSGVTSIGEFAFYNCTGSFSVTFGSGVTSIGEYAFDGCSGLTSVRVPDSVTSIGDYAFYDCSGLQEVYITDLVKWCEISFANDYSNPLYYATHLYVNGEEPKGALVIPDGVTSIGTFALSGCTGLTSVTIPSSVESIGDCAFWGCTGLTSVTIENGVTSIGSCAFSGCTGLTSVTIENGVTSIGVCAFWGCTGLTSVTIPSSVTSIGEAVFSGCSSLQSITLPFVGDSIKTESDTHQYPFGYIFGAYSYEGGVATKQSYHADNTVTVTSTTYHIPSTLRSVTITGGNLLQNAFESCTNLTSVVLGSGVTSIGFGTFSCCTGLTSVTIGTGVTNIGGCAFSDCIGLTSVTIPSSVTSIGDCAFSGCTGLTSVTIENGVTSIGEDAFDSCTGLTSVTIPSSVTSIGDWAFYGCSHLTAVYISTTGWYYTSRSTATSGTSVDLSNASTAATYLTSTYKDYYFKRNITDAGSISENVSVGTIIGTTSEKHLDFTLSSNGASYVVTGLGTVTDPDIVIPATYEGKPVTAIADETFKDCTKITSVTIPGSVTSIGLWAFEGCTGLISVTIPDSVTSISYVAFIGCSGITSITVATGNTTYHSAGNCLIETDSKTLILGCQNSVIPTDGSVTSIGTFALSGCTGLTSVKIPSSVTSVGDCAFNGCTGLTTVTIPSSVTSIGLGAFSGCSSLQSITLPFVGDSIKTESDNYQYPFGYIFGVHSYEGGVATSQEYYGSSISSKDSGLYYIPSALRNVTITGGNILYGAFWNCTGLTSVTIPDSVTSIGEAAFENCEGLISVTIPSNVRSIGSEAFCGCSGLTSVTIPNNVTSIGDSAFFQCTNLTAVYISTTGWYYTSESTATSGTSVDLSNPSTAATYLTSTYSNYYFKRNG